MKQLIINLPDDIPMPLYKIGDRVLFRIDHQNIEGRICGMEYTSHDAALSEGITPGWDYHIELPAFSRPELKHVVMENGIRPAQPQEVA